MSTHEIKFTADFTITIQQAAAVFCSYCRESLPDRRNNRNLPDGDGGTVSHPYAHNAGTHWAGCAASELWLRLS